MSKTTVQIENTTLEELKTLRLTKRDTYNEIIVRMIEALHKKG